MNRVVLIGRLTADPELRFTQSGIAVAKFTLAIDRNYANQQGERETDFIDVVVWRKLAELCGQYLKKGSLAAADGSIQVRSYQTAEGQKRRAWEVVAENVRFLDKREAGTSQSQVAPPKAEDSIETKSTSEEFDGINLDDIPF